MKKIMTLIAIVLVLAGTNGCKKEFLAAKPSSNIVQPVTLDNLIGLLDNNEQLNLTPALPTLSADEYSFIDEAAFQSTNTAIERNAYTWAKDVYQGRVEIRDWIAPYAGVFYANNALFGIENISRTADNANKWSYVKGAAYFFRAYHFYNLANTFCKAYDENSLDTDLGIPLKLKPGIDEIVQRATLGQTYAQILADLKEAELLLSGSAVVPTEKKNRPSLTAVYALQARVYLSMRNYDQANIAATKCLGVYSDLVDYNDLAFPVIMPFQMPNEQCIFYANATGYASIIALYNTQTVMNMDLLTLYEPGDLRHDTYFTPGNGGYVMNGSPVGGLTPFTGLSTDEVYLIKAECEARIGSITECESVLNRLLIKRYTPASYVPTKFYDKTAALNRVLVERRKELVFRGARWSDLKRLNKEGANITLNRQIAGAIYTLSPNDPRYALPIPNDEIALSGLVQNPR